MTINSIMIKEDKYNSYGFRIFYTQDMRFKNRIDICEPTLSNQEDYYSDYYEINHSSFLVLHYNTMKLDVLLYDSETGNIYNSGSIIQKPIYNSELTETNTINIVSAFDSSIESNVDSALSKQLLEIPITKMLTYGEFLQISNYRQFRLVHTVEHGCDCCSILERKFLQRLDRMDEKDYIGMYRLLEANKSVYIYNRVVLDKIVTRLNIMVLNLYSKNYYPKATVHGDYCNKIVDFRDYLMANI